MSDQFNPRADPTILQELGVHANLCTTTRCNRRGEVANAKAAGLLVFPCN